jgi:hypothetical protein
LWRGKKTNQLHGKKYKHFKTCATFREILVSNSIRNKSPTIERTHRRILNTKICPYKAFNNVMT